MSNTILQPRAICLTTIARFKAEPAPTATFQRLIPPFEIKKNS